MKRYLMIFLAAFMAFHCMGASLPSQVDSHDIALYMHGDLIPNAMQASRTYLI